MHEMAIVDNLMTLVDEQVKEHQLKKVSRVHLVVGELTGVVEDVLIFCWQVASEGTPYQEAQLSIDAKPAIALCADCSEEYPLKQSINHSCPGCGGAVKKLLSGKELFIDWIEAE